ncbi:hypothetical protein CDD83_9532 [Cordyceps sp. RAO-2017]|nr:hypothetical protein CDD83_9532 [Cordyceps sp. RAO-2017]
MKVFSTSVEVTEEVIEAITPTGDDAREPEWLQDVKERVGVAKAAAEKTTHSIGQYFTDIWAAGTKAASKKLKSTKEALEREQQILNHEINAMAKEIKSVLSATIPKESSGPQAGSSQAQTASTAAGLKETIKAIPKSIEKAQMAKYASNFAHEPHKGTPAPADAHGRKEAQPVEVEAIHVPKVPNEEPRGEIVGEGMVRTTKLNTLPEVPQDMPGVKKPQMAPGDDTVVKQIGTMPEVPKGEPGDDAVLKQIKEMPKVPKEEPGDDAVMKQIKAMPKVPKEQPGDDAVMKQIKAMPKVPKEGPGDDAVLKQINAMPKVPKEEPDAKIHESKEGVVKTAKGFPNPHKGVPGIKESEVMRSTAT